jgi:multiple sugar transport system ATP-binding protein
MVLARIGGQEVTCLFHERLATRPGEVLHVLPDRRRSHLFDLDSGTRLAA